MEIPVTNGGVILAFQVHLGLRELRAHSRRFHGAWFTQPSTKSHPRFCHSAEILSRRLSCSLGRCWGSRQRCGSWPRAGPESSSDFRLCTDSFQLLVKIYQVSWEHCLRDCHLAHIQFRYNCDQLNEKAPIDLSVEVLRLRLGVSERGKRRKARSSLESTAAGFTNRDVSTVRDLKFSALLIWLIVMQNKYMLKRSKRNKNIV